MGYTYYNNYTGWRSCVSKRVSMEDILEYLAKAEGTRIHKHKNELDITAPYGIYRYAHPGAEIFRLIDELAGSVKVYAESKDWTEYDIDKVNKVLRGYEKEVRQAAYKFYKKYLATVNLDKFPKPLRLVFFSLYVLSPNTAIRVLQKAIRQAIPLGIIIDTNLRDVSTVDGRYGNKTEKSLSFIPENGIMVIKLLIMSNAKTYLTKIASDNPDKYLLNLKGWFNRLDNLINE